MNETELKNRNNIWFAAVMFSAVFGVICGAFVSGGADDFPAAALLSPADRLPAEIAANSFIRLGLLVGVCFLCGFSAVMQPVEAVIPFFFGTGFGLCSAELCGSDSVGMFIMLLPGGVFSAAALSFASRESMRMSSAVFRRTFMPAEYEPADCLLYLKKFALIFVMTACASAADGLSAFVYHLLRK